ncbi:MAG: divalent metal cation transporter [Sandaracinaceae bacterium]|nr:divalent metal cation transporter [Sandaracinaceae bacterium]
MRRELLRALGPGVLFTGAAVGVSHLVQSTRAGAVYGLALAGLVVLANLVKYPAFRFGPMYAAATGTSMLEGYRRQGRWALVLYGLLTLGTMFTVQAAVTIVTAGLAGALFGLDASPLVISGGLLVVCAGLVATGGYRALDKVGKVIVAFLAVSTLLATALVLPRIAWSEQVWWPSRFEPADIAFMAALVGWMPSAIDVSVWQSLWTLARGSETGGRSEAKASSVDFHIGYVGTAVLAVCFVLLGAAVLHGDGAREIPERPVAFAALVISVYVDALGEWSRPLIGGAAFATMFSTTLTVVDGFPRAIAVLVERLRSEETPDAAGTSDRTPAYWGALGVLFVGSLVLLGVFAESMKALIDLATTLSFLSAPVLSFLNHRAVTSADVPEGARPAKWLVASSWVAIALQAAFAIAFVVLIS